MMYVLRFIISLVFLFCTTLLMLVCAVFTLFQCRGWYADVLLPWVARGLLAIWRIEIRSEPKSPWQLSEQTVFIINHSSSLDLFVLLALGIPRTRFFLSGHLRKTGLIGLWGYVIGVFWTVPQSFPERRRAIFKRAEVVLKATGDSVLLSPEGERVLGGKIGHFNKGAFHLAMSLQAPIVPIYIHIPKAIDPGVSLRFRPGCVEVKRMDAISTQSWQWAEVLLHKEEVRDLYQQWQTDYQQRENHGR